MGWALIAGLFVVTAGGLVLIGRLPRGLWEMVAATLLFGAAGYAWQGSAGLAGSPRKAAQNAPAFDRTVVQIRRSFGEYGQTGQWLAVSDALASQGRSEDAANVILSGLRANPKDAGLWTGLGNALVAHGEGVLSPAAEYSYAQAMRLEPDRPAAAFFYGLRLAEAGRYAPARKIWADLREKLPEGAPLRAQLTGDIAKLDSLISGQSVAGQGVSAER